MKRLLFAMVVLLMLSGCAFYRSKPVSDNLENKTLRLGMTAKEVRTVVGDPYEITKRQVSPSDVREVWTYKEYQPDGASIGIGFILFGITWVIPPTPTFQNVVIQNDKFIGVNMPDPYAPQLIIEKREQ